MYQWGLMEGVTVEQIERRIKGRRKSNKQTVGRTVGAIGNSNGGHTATAGADDPALAALLAADIELYHYAAQHVEESRSSSKDDG